MENTRKHFKYLNNGIKYELTKLARIRDHRTKPELRTQLKYVNNFNGINYILLMNCLDVHSVGHSIWSFWGVGAGGGGGCSDAKRCCTLATRHYHKPGRKIVVRFYTFRGDVI